MICAFTASARALTYEEKLPACLACHGEKGISETADPRTAARAQAVIATNHCGSCHNPDFSGREQMPRLAAQREDYLLKALRDYKGAKRPGYDATMDEVIRPVTEADIVDLAHYLARLK